MSVRVAVIGCGVIAPTHASALSAIKDAQITWACDLIEDRARALAERFDIPNVTTEAIEAIAADNVDAVTICTDHASHAELAIAAMNAGKHVLCEKALAASDDQLDAMLQRHREVGNGLAFAGIFQHRFNPVYQLTRKYVRDGMFGKILTGEARVLCERTNEYYHADSWRGTWEGEGGSVLINQAIHTIDILAWMLDGVQSVSATYSNRTHGGTIETEDTAVAAVTFDDGALGTINATCSSHLHWEPAVSIHGSDGSVKIYDGHLQRASFRDPSMESQFMADLEEMENTTFHAEGKSYYGGHHGSQIEDFVSAVRDRRPPFVTAASARHAVDVVLGIYRSHQSGQWTSIGSRP
ncbi:MAG: Gfo/Idh/MocA family protein [Phycisphaerae bacterium]